jgi:hypothetical protein
VLYFRGASPGSVANVPTVDPIVHASANSSLMFSHNLVGDSLPVCLEQREKINQPEM